MLKYQRGQSLTGYVISIAAVALIILVGASLYGTKIRNYFFKASEHMASPQELSAQDKKGFKAAVNESVIPEEMRSLLEEDLGAAKMAFSKVKFEKERDSNFEPILSPKGDLDTKEKLESGSASESVESGSASESVESGSAPLSLESVEFSWQDVHYIFGDGGVEPDDFFDDEGDDGELFDDEPEAPLATEKLEFAWQDIKYVFDEGGIEDTDLFTQEDFEDEKSVVQPSNKIDGGKEGVTTSSLAIKKRKQDEKMSELEVDFFRPSEETGKEEDYYSEDGEGGLTSSKISGGKKGSIKKPESKQ